MRVNEKRGVYLSLSSSSKVSTILAEGSCMGLGSSRAEEICAEAFEI